VMQRDQRGDVLRLPLGRTAQTSRAAPKYAAAMRSSWVRAVRRSHRRTRGARRARAGPPAVTRAPVP
jgi:hypothetical protein